MVPTAASLRIQAPCPAAWRRTAGTTFVNQYAIGSSSTQRLRAQSPHSVTQRPQRYREEDDVLHQEVSQQRQHREPAGLGGPSHREW